MAKRFSKLLVLLMACVFLISIFAGCARKTDKPTDVTEEPAPSEESAQKPPEQPTEKPEKNEEVRDLGGRVIKVAAWWDKIGRAHV